MSLHTINTYKDKQDQWRWSIAVTPGTPAGTPEDVVADSGQGYANRKDMLNSLFGILFGSYDDSFLELYAEWNPDNAQDNVGVPSVAEQAGSAPWSDDVTRAGTLGGEA